MLTLLGQQLFPADYPWNQNIANAPVAANSAAVISNIGASVHIHPDWGDDNPANGNAPLYGIPVNIVHGTGMATINVQIDNYPDESDIVPVPIPANAVIEGDYQNGPNLNGAGYGENGNPNQRGDSHLIVYDTDNKIAYELYGVSRPNDPTLFPDNNDVEAIKTDMAWHAAQETVWYMKDTEQFRTLGATSADAAGLSILAGLARPDEGLTVAQGGQGAINHALRFTLPSTVVNPQYIYPASHMVRETQASNKLPFGARLRLANTAAVNTKIAAMPAESQIIAHAMQQFGLVLADIGSAMYVTGASSTTDNVDNPHTKLVWNQNDIFASSGLKTLVASDFQVVDLTPRVTGLSATSGSPGSTLTITGQSFSGAAGQLYVNFGSMQIGPVTPISDAQIKVTIPSGSGTVDVTVQSGVVKTGSNQTANVTKPIFGYGTSVTSSVDRFTFVAPGSLTLTWNGAANGNWTDPQWNGATFSYPDANINAAIHTASVVQVTASQAAHSLALSSGAQVTVGAGASLAVSTSTSATAGSALNINAGGTFSTGQLMASSLIIGGSPGSLGKATIVATDASGHPLTDSTAGQSTGAVASFDRASNPLTTAPSAPPPEEVDMPFGFFSNQASTHNNSERTPRDPRHSMPASNSDSRNPSDLAFSAVFGSDGFDAADLRPSKWLGADFQPTDASTPADLTADLRDVIWNPSKFGIRV
jgi:hypothetical protein